MIRTLRRVASILPFAGGLTDAATSFVIVIVPIGFTSVDYAIHVAVTFGVRHILIHAEARPAACTATLAFVVPSKSISTSKSAATFEASVRSLASVKFRVAFQIVEAAETRLARRAFVRLLLAVSQEMALQVVVAREVCRAVWAFMTFRRR